ncbi:DUF4402 domain-containing protein [Labilibaculum antarcticum]|uniref:DUF4402 domain-containing protein n=1 Tax=Labilibaculum antarcticum TaxID=1717717 RepID=A0A1Y1CLC6_9BACT|nr:DUF4402 domain-containing protein [Labilibaculum antarcticum]BAX80061.1 hypothetical protein ALGA_1686 [Labilibaculum antarcticum]
MILAFKRSRLLTFICGGLLFLLSHLSLVAQEPAVPFSVVTIQDISFGAFFQGSSGGTVTVSPDGTRLLSGDMIVANVSGFSYYPAIYELEAEPGTLVFILKGSDTGMSRSNGGSISLQVGDSEPGFPIIVPPSGRIQVRMGGILTMENPQANSSGDYSGSLEVTFIQE